MVYNTRIEGECKRGGFSSKKEPPSHKACSLPLPPQFRLQPPSHTAHTLYSALCTCCKRLLLPWLGGSAVAVERTVRGSRRGREEKGRFGVSGIGLQRRLRIRRNRNFLGQTTLARCLWARTGTSPWWAPRSPPLGTTSGAGAAWGSRG